MLRFLRQLAKPVAAVSLAGFVGQLLLICCIGTAAAATVDKPAPNSHCHAQAGTAQHDDGQGACPHHHQDGGKTCCQHDQHSPLLIDAARKPAPDNNAFFMLPPLAVVTVPALDLGVTHSAVNTGYRPRGPSAPPIYLANCTFLE